MRNYPGTLTDGEPLSEENVGHNVLQYVWERFLFELHPVVVNGQTNSTLINAFDTDLPIRIVLTNNHNLFLEKPEENLTSKKRRRWVRICDDEASKTRTIYVQIRDKEPQRNSDLIEIFSFLGILHIARSAEFGKINHYIQDTKEKPNTFSSQEDFNNWKGKDITVSIDFDGQRENATSVLTQQIEKALGSEIASYKENPPYLLIGNDFALRLMAFTLIITNDQKEKLKGLFSDELSTLEGKLRERNINPELWDFIIKYYLLQRLYKEKKDPQLLVDIFSQENYQRLGFRRLLYGITKPQTTTLQSILAEPVDLWEPEKIKDESILSDETSPIAKLIRELKNQKIKILSIPYVIGHLSTDLFVDLKNKELIRNDKVGFLGKVGHGTTTQPPLKIGDIVSIEKCSNTQQKEIDYPPQPESNLGISITPANLLTVPAVTLQSYQDVKAVEKNRPVVIDMEQHPFLQVLQDSNTCLRAFFYVSDISKKPGKDGGVPDSKKITHSMAPETGSIAVVLTTLLVLESLASNV